MFFEKPDQGVTWQFAFIYMLMFLYFSLQIQQIVYFLSFFIIVSYIFLLFLASNIFQSSKHRRSHKGHAPYFFPVLPTSLPTFLSSILPSLLPSSLLNKKEGFFLLISWCLPSSAKSTSYITAGAASVASVGNWIRWKAALVGTPQGDHQCTH